MRTVYRYKVYDINSDTEIIAATYAAKQFIEKIEGANLLSKTAIEVSEDQIDEDGKLVSKK